MCFCCLAACGILRIWFYFYLAGDLMVQCGNYWSQINALFSMGGDLLGYGPTGSLRAIIENPRGLVLSWRNLWRSFFAALVSFSLGFSNFCRVSARHSVPRRLALGSGAWMGPLWV